MNDSEYQIAIEALKRSYARAQRRIAEWLRYTSGEESRQPTTRLSYIFRPQGLLVQDTLGLIAKVNSGEGVKVRSKAIYALIKSTVSELGQFITVPVIKPSSDIAVVRGLFDLIYKRLTEEMSDSQDGSELTVPQNTGDHTEYKVGIKKLAHRLCGVLISSSKFPLISKYPQARDYIVHCTRGQQYYTQCKAIQDAMEAYGWKSQSLLTFCKGGSTYDTKTNDARQTKVSKKKRRVSKDLKGAWHDAVP